MTTERAFRRSFASIPDIFAFTAEVFASERVEPLLLPSIDLTLEELFTNMVKYSASVAAVRIGIAKVEGGVQVTVTDYDVEPFDVTRASAVDIDLPIEQRRPGGLGLHLVRRLVDCIDYQYFAESRQSRITFRKTQAERRLPTAGGSQGASMLTIDFGPDGSVLVAGRLDAAQSPAAQAFLDQVQGTVTLDCSGLEYISSAGLGVLLRTQKRLMGSAGKLRLSGVNRHLRDIFVYSGFDKIFEIEPAP